MFLAENDPTRFRASLGTTLPSRGGIKRQTSNATALLSRAIASPAPESPMA
jgi:hypothetical protein